MPDPWRDSRASGTGNGNMRVRAASRIAWQNHLPVPRVSRHHRHVHAATPDFAHADFGRIDLQQQRSSCQDGEVHARHGHRHSGRRGRPVRSGARAAAQRSLSQLRDAAGRESRLRRTTQEGVQSATGRQHARSRSRWTSICRPWVFLWPLSGRLPRLAGFFPIINAPDTKLSESWHFDCRGSHDAVYRYVAFGKAGVSMPPYTQMAHSAILAIGVHVDSLPAQDAAWV